MIGSRSAHVRAVAGRGAGALIAAIGMAGHLRAHRGAGARRRSGWSRARSRCAVAARARAGRGTRGARRRARHRRAAAAEFRDLRAAHGADGDVRRRAAAAGRRAGFRSPQHWKLYLPVVLVSFVLMVPPILYADRRNRPSRCSRRSACCSRSRSGSRWLGSRRCCARRGDARLSSSLSTSSRRSLPSLVSRLAPAHARGDGDRRLQHHADAGPVLRRASPAAGSRNTSAPRACSAPVRRWPAFGWRWPPACAPAARGRRSTARRTGVG